MRLSEIEKRVLTAVEGRAEVPLTELEKTTKLRSSAIRYHLNNLIEKGVLLYYPFVNTYLLGYAHHNFFFSLSFEGKSREPDLIKYLMASPKVSFLVELSGSYNYCVSIVAKNSVEISGFLDDLGARFGSIFGKIDYATRVSLNMFPSKYITRGKGDPFMLTWGESGARVEIDALDRQILSTLVNEKYTSRRDVARQLGLSISTLDYRIKKLVDNKIIVDFVYITNSSTIGMLEFKVLLHLKARDSNFHKALIDFSRQHPHIVVVIECIGTWGYELSVEVTSPAQLPQVMQDLYVKFGRYISHVQELTICRHLKLSCFPFALNEQPKLRAVANS